VLATFAIRPQIDSFIVLNLLFIYEQIVKVASTGVYGDDLHNGKDMSQQNGCHLHSMLELMTNVACAGAGNERKVSRG
jgi:hypothetical protein